ncbi:MAG: oligoribonuclease [Gammaproteobacteria bacterium]|jgi:oligoribonuclease
MNQSPDNLIWIDLEMTGLNPDTDYIIEIATVITDASLEIIAEGPVFAIQTENAALLAMDEWNTSQHNKSGLVARIQNSQVTCQEAESKTLTFLRQHVPENTSPMCGNSICQDRRFMHRLMPELENYFHYRNLDVSSFKELVQRWAPEKKQFSKHSSHLALNDIKDSIEELRFYRENYFNI